MYNMVWVGGYSMGYVDNYEEPEDGEFSPLTEEDIEEMYQRFLVRLRERYPDKWNDGEKGAKE